MIFSLALFLLFPLSYLIGIIHGSDTSVIHGYHFFLLGVLILWVGDARLYVL